MGNNIDIPQTNIRINIEQLTLEELKVLEKIARKDPQIAEYLRKNDQSICPYSSEKDPWIAYTLGDAYKKLTPPIFLVEGLLTLPSLNILYGAPGTLKSFMLADMMVSVAAGEDWLPPAEGATITQTRKTIKYPVMWIDFDNGSHRTHERFGALGRARNLSPELGLTYYTMPMPRLDGTSKESVGQLGQRIKEKEAKLIAIDNLSCVSGNAEENGSEMSRVMASFRELAEETQSTIVLIHHQRKNNNLNARVGETLRGHSGIEGAIDLALLAERNEGADHVLIKSTKDRGEKVNPFAAMFTFEKDFDGTLAKARFFGDCLEHVLPKKQDPLQGKIDQAILGILQTVEVNKQSLIKKTQEMVDGIGEKKIGLRIDALTDQKLIGVKQGSKPKEKVFYLPEKTTDNQQLPLTTASCEIEEGF